MATLSVSDYRKALKACQTELREFIDDANCNPILVRFAWHDSGTYDKNIKTFPECGGANGSIMYEPEISHAANAGLAKAVNYLKPFKAKYPILSYADIIQLASAEAILLAGGPKIDMIYGRIDSNICPKEGNLPGANSPFANAQNAQSHLRNVFYRMGFNDREIVALSGAHTLGRAFKERSGTSTFGYGKENGTSWTNGSSVVRKDQKKGVGMPGGQSWTSNWLTFDNSYFSQHLASNLTKPNSQLLWLETDKSVSEDSGFKEHFIEFAKNQEKFFEEYAKVHKKLSELGARFFVEGGIKIEAAGSKL